MTRPRVLLADDHRIVVAGLEALLRDDYELVGHAPDGRSLLQMARTTTADFIVAEGSQAVCYVTLDDVLIVATSFVDGDARAAGLRNALDATQLMNDAYNAVPRPES